MIEEEAAQTLHHGRPGLPSRRKEALAKEIGSREGSDGWEDLTSSLLASPQPAVRQVGAILLGDPRTSREAFGTHIDQVATDPDWEVREWAVSPLERWWDRDPAGVDTRVSAWLDQGPFLRRAAVVFSRRMLLVGSWPCERVLPIAEKVLNDPDPYVLGNVGSYLVGDGLLRMCPEETVALLIRALKRTPDDPALLKNLSLIRKSRDGLARKEWLEVQLAAHLQGIPGRGRDGSPLRRTESEASH